jgi:putative salt-induced outer membrane protein YdiY
MAIPFFFYVIAAGPAAGDTVVLTDGSRIVGTIERLSDGKLVITTAFAGTIEIDATLLQSLKTDRKINMAFASGDRLLGPVVWPDGPETPVIETGVGPITVAIEKVTAIWPEGADSPEVLAAKAEAETKLAAVTPDWSVTVEAGGTMTEGNTDTLTGMGKVEVLRKTSRDLLKFYLAAIYGEEDNARTQNEYKGGVLFEGNITDRWFWYARTELEFDEFEDIDLRATAAAGAGYYWIKEDDHELKTRGGLGYRHETFDDGSSEDAAIVDLGLDYRLDILTWAQFTHSTTYSPDIERWSDYRLTLDTAMAIPLADSEKWKLKFGIQNKYNSHPAPGIDRLDNLYYANIVVGIK